MVKLYSGHFQNWSYFFVHFQIDEERMANLDKNGRTDSNAGCNGCLPPSASNVEVRLPMGEDEPGMTMMNSNLYMSSSDMRHNNQQRTAVRIDEVCRFVFPLGFIIFNVCYWNYYNTPEVAEDWVFLIFEVSLMIYDTNCETSSFCRELLFVIDLQQGFQSKILAFQFLKGSRIVTYPFKKLFEEWIFCIRHPVQ